VPTPKPRCRGEDHHHSAREARVSSRAALSGAAALFEAMGDEHRLRILELLRQGEWCVTELVDEVEEKFSTVSQRLRVLRSARLVVRRRQGTHLFYALADRHVADLIDNALAHASEREEESKEEVGHDS
jgi:DNA-binding transcriptional ArsR family regulator